MIPRHLVIAVIVMLMIVVSMGIYLQRMSHSAAEMQRLASDTRPIAPPPSGPTETAALYIADDGGGALHVQSAKIPLPGGRQQRAEELIRALLRIYQQPDSPHPIAPAADLRSVYLVDPGVAVIDLNAAFAEQHRSGILTEQLTVGSLVQTLASNIPGITRVRILIDGNARETLAGHTDLTEFFDVRAVGQSMAQNQ